MKFWKMHGLGNDYIVIDDRREITSEERLPKLAQKLCRRGFSIGADGILLVRNSKVADIRMRIFNSDGSEAEMCGNGVRCIAKYCYDNRIVPKKTMKVETLAGIRKLEILTEGKSIANVRADMGAPSFQRKDVPMVGEGECINEPINIGGRELKITCVSMGNPHCVTFVLNSELYPVHEIGAQLEKHPYFPEHTNVEFVTVQNQGEITVRTWERGVGETSACGTGACASAAAAHRLNKTGKKVEVNLLGGTLLVELDGSIALEGLVEKIFEGQLFQDDPIGN
jgi:diaminopimelate epimerase